MTAFDDVFDEEFFIVSTLNSKFKFVLLKFLFLFNIIINNMFWLV